jgi:hypothetical protein
MTKFEADRNAYAVHNAKSLLVATKERNNKLSNADDADAIKLHKDLCEAIKLCTSIEFDLDHIPDVRLKASDLKVPKK